MNTRKTENFIKEIVYYEKKILVSAVLAIVLMMSFSVTAFAASYLGTFSRGTTSQDTVVVTNGGYVDDRNTYSYYI